MALFGVGTVLVESCCDSDESGASVELRDVCAFEATNPTERPTSSTAARIFIFTPDHALPTGDDALREESVHYGALYVDARQLL